MTNNNEKSVEDNKSEVSYFWRIVAVLSIVIFAIIAREIVMMKYDIAKRRIELEFKKIENNLEIEKLKIEKNSSIKRDICKPDVFDAKEPSCNVPSILNHFKNCSFLGACCVQTDTPKSHSKKPGKKTKCEPTPEKMSPEGNTEPPLPSQN